MVKGYKRVNEEYELQTNILVTNKQLKTQINQFDQFLNIYNDNTNKYNNVESKEILLDFIENESVKNNITDMNLNKKLDKI